jgi:hypothetical protein
VRKLYLHSGCDYFASRVALGLTYQVCREDTWAREQRRSEKLRRRLGPDGERPKGMHWRTYEQIANAAEEAETRSWMALLHRYAPTYSPKV